MKIITFVLSLSAFLCLFTAFSPTAASSRASIGDGPQTKALWVFGDSVVPHPVTDPGGRVRLVSRSSGDGVNALYVSVFRSPASSSGRFMYEDSDLAALISLAHSAGLEVWAEHGNADWPTFTGCNNTDRPVQRIQDIINYNNAALSPEQRFDGIMLDVEPGSAFDLTTYVGLHQCLRGRIPASLNFGTAINAFWSTSVEYPLGSGIFKPQYAHIIDQNIDKIVVMGYRDTAGGGVCPAGGGLICLDTDEIAYASSIGKTDALLVGLETMNVSPGQPETVSFFEEGVNVMNAEALTTQNHFAPEPSFGGFAIHNYHAAYLSDTAGWPLPSALGTCSSGQNVDVEATGGLPSAGYATLKGAFDTINSGTHTGVINIEICGNTDELSTPAVLNSSGADSASYSSINIYPLADGLTVAGTPPTGRGVIELNGADNVTIDGDNPSTAGTGRNLTLRNSAVSTTTFGQVVRIALNPTSVNSANGCAIKNLNVLGNATGRNVSAAVSAAGAEITTYGIYAGGGANVTATVAPSAISSPTTTVGAGAVATDLTISNNNIQNAARGIAVQGAATTVFPGLLIENNTVGNSTAGALDQVYSMGITAQGSANAVIRANSIFVESFVSTSLRAIDIGSISPQTSAALIEKNNIGRVRNNHLQTRGAFGINLNGGSSHVVQNNFVSDVRSDQTSGTNAFTTTDGVFGIRVFQGTGHKILHNSVNLYGSVPGTSGSTLTASFMIATTGLTGVDVRNNIFSNQLSGGNPAGIRHACIYLPTSGFSMNLTLNNNVYYQGTDPSSRLAQTGTTVGANDYLAANFNPAATTPANNLRSYTATMSGAGTNDSASFAATTAPPFVSNTDLHISSSTVLESTGANAGVSDDFDGQARGASPDIGADEFAGVPADTTLPVITYTALANTSTTANRVVSAAISDNVAVASGAVLPRVYFRKNAGAYFSTQCSLTSGTAQSGTYDCTIDYSLIGGVTAADVVGYFVIAQDTAGNVASSPAGAVAADVNTVTTPPTPNNYTILQTFTGAVSVGTGETIASLTNPGGLFELMNAGTISGNITINITSDLTAETGTHSLNQQVEDGAGNWTITFQASGAPRLIEGSNSTSALINLTGADRVTFSGLAFGPHGLTIRNLGDFPTFRFEYDASNNSILNCQVEGRDPSGDGVILIGRGFFLITGNDNNSITGSIVRDLSTTSGVPRTLIRNQGFNELITNSNTVIADNELFNFSGQAYLSDMSDNDTVTGNTIYQTSTGLTGSTGVQFNYVQGSNTISGNTIRDFRSTSATGIAMLNGGHTTVSRNSIYNLSNASSSITGISFSGLSGASLTVENNLISITPLTSASSGFVVKTGITDAGAAGSTFNAFHNTIYLSGPPGPSLDSSWALRKIGASNHTSRNNILFNDRTGGANNFAIGDQSPGSGTFDSDHNIFVGTGTTADNFFQRAGIAVDFATWQAGPPARDANSFAGVAGVGPFNAGNMFISDSDLHLRVGAGNPAINAGIASGVMTDFDGQVRPFGPAPDIGADEIQTVPTAAGVSLSGRVTDSNGRGIRNIRVTVHGGWLAEPMSVVTGPFGYFRFDDLRAGETYVVSVSGKRYNFQVPARVVSLVDDLTDLDFTGELR